MINDFDKAILNLARAQQRVKELLAEHSLVLMTIDTAKQDAKMQEQNLRIGAMEYYAETGDRLPHEAIAVKSVTRQHYNTRTNVARALLNNPNALRINQDLFRAYAGRVAWLINETERLLVPAAFPNARELMNTALEFRSVLLEMLEVDEKAARDGSWAIPEPVHADEVHLKSRLGEYLIFQESKGGILTDPDELS